jgi:hypothetical protein
MTFLSLSDDGSWFNNSYGMFSMVFQYLDHFINL